MSTALFAAAARLLPSDGYALAYGSHATAPGPTSDLDLLFTGTRPLHARQLGSLIDAVKQLHTDHGLALDEEVAFENKVFATHDDIERAARLDGFADVCERSDAAGYAAPVGNPDALNSPGFRLRLVLNVLSSAHVFLAGDVAAYRRHAELAERGCALLALRVCGARTIALDEVVDALVSSPQGLTGRHFLGYRGGPQLHSVVRRGLAHLEHDGLIRIADEVIIRRHP